MLLAILLGGPASMPQQLQVIGPQHAEVIETISKVLSTSGNGQEPGNGTPPNLGEIMVNLNERERRKLLAVATRKLAVDRRAEHHDNRAAEIKALIERNSPDESEFHRERRRLWFWNTIGALLLILSLATAIWSAARFTSSWLGQFAMTVAIFSVLPSSVHLLLQHKEEQGLDRASPQAKVVKAAMALGLLGGISLALLRSADVYHPAAWGTLNLLGTASGRFSLALLTDQRLLGYARIAAAIALGLGAELLLGVVCYEWYELAPFVHSLVASGREKARCERWRDQARESSARLAAKIIELVARARSRSIAQKLP